jgi:signal transduction histidine kinase
VPAIQELAKSFRKKANADVDFLNLVQDVNLSPEEEIQVFHIIQESLYNIAKHARARHVVVTFDLRERPVHRQRRRRWRRRAEEERSPPPWARASA